MNRFPTIATSLTSAPTAGRSALHDYAVRAPIRCRVVEDVVLDDDIVQELRTVDAPADAGLDHDVPGVSAGEAQLPDRDVRRGDLHDRPRREAGVDRHPGSAPGASNHPSPRIRA